MSKIHFVPSDSPIVVESYLEGKVSLNVRMVIDTGASFVVIRPWVAKSLGLKLKGTMLITTASLVEKAPLSVIPKLRVLEEEVNNVSCIVKDLPSDLRVSGLLGLSFLRHFKVTIDFKKGILVLE